EMGGAHGGLRGKGPMCYEANAHVPLIIVHPNGKAGKSCDALTSHIDLLPTFVGLAGIPPAKRPAMKDLRGRDFSALVADPVRADVHALRPGVLFNYVGLTRVDGDYYVSVFLRLVQGKRPPAVTDIKLDKRGFLSFVFDGRYKFARYYAPNDFNTPKTLEQLFKRNDVQAFDLKTDPDEMTNLALEREKNKDTIQRLNTLLNELMAREVGVNDGSFLPDAVRPKKPSRRSDQR